jgi:hypothetical protein
VIGEGEMPSFEGLGSQGLDGECRAHHHEQQRHRGETLGDDVDVGDRVEKDDRQTRARGEPGEREIRRRASREQVDPTRPQPHRHRLR